jgi:hypothetical protein
MMEMRWGGTEKGWTLETDKPISQARFMQIWEYTIRDQTRQISTMPPGPELKVYQDAFFFLKDMRITHTVNGIIQPQGGAN